MTTPFTLPPVNKENIPQCADLSHKIFPEVLSGAQRLSSKVSKIRSSSTCAASPIDFFTRKALLAEFIYLLPEVVCIIDAKGSLLAHNSKFKKSILAFDQIDASDPSSIDIFRFISPKDHVNFASSLQAVAGSKASEEEPSYVQSVNTGDIGLTGMSNEGKRHRIEQSDGILLIKMFFRM